MMPCRLLKRTPAGVGVAAVAMLLAAVGGATTTEAGSLPEIRTSSRNRVPSCVTPARMMRFLADRNPGMQAKFRNIATYYKAHGERLAVRWDYAFFQMIVETNYLLFRTETRRGDVSPSQNNFAGIGTTGGGVPGDSFPDVSTGVLAQMQHLIAYSGEWVEKPVARRTREKQSDIISASRRLRRAVTFQDLAGRWAVDRRYGRTIASIAELYRKRFCTGRQVEPEPETPTAPNEVTAQVPRRAPATAVASASGTGTGSLPHGPQGERLTAAPARASRPSLPCKVFTASYGGTKNVLIRRRVGDEIHFTALQVLDGREQGLTEAFIRSHALGGIALGEFANRDAALASAFHRCPAGQTAATNKQG
ncbi:MAG: glucosaminidase domain-containing protein [Hyphomicrobiaceae bacterium]